MVYKSTNKTYDFRNFKTIRDFGSQIKNNVINEDMANNEQNELFKHIEEFTRTTTKIIKKKEVLDSALALLQRRAMVFTAFKIGTFPRSEESQEGEGLKMLYLIKCLKDYQ